MQFEFFCKACTLLCINICMIIMTPPSPLVRDFPLFTCIFHIYFAVKITAIIFLLKIILGTLYDGLAFGNRHIKAELYVGIIPSWSRSTKQVKCIFACLARMVLKKNDSTAAVLL